MMRALVVDDSEATRTILRRLLTALEFDVLEAGDGWQALRLLAAEGPVEVCLVDWNMPVMDGLAFIRALRRDASHAGCKVLMVTTEAQAERVAEALEAGADEYAMKPFDRDVITRKLSIIGVGADAGIAGGVW